MKFRNKFNKIFHLFGKLNKKVKVPACDLFFTVAISKELDKRFDVKREVRTENVKRKFHLRTNLTLHQFHICQ